MVKVCLESASETKDSLDSIVLYFEIWLLLLGGYLPDWNKCDICKTPFSPMGKAHLQVNFHLICSVCSKTKSHWMISPTEREIFNLAQKVSPLKFIEFTNNAIYLEDEEMAVIRLGREVKVRKIKDDELVAPYIQELQMNLEQIEKGGYDHFMLKEIHEQPSVIKDTYRGRLLADEGIVRLGGLENYIDKFTNADRIIIVACGTSWHAGLVAEYFIEDFTRIPVEVEYASEFRYRNPIITEKDVVIAISQSGETADTLAAIKLAKQKGAFVYGVCNVVGSTISRETHSGFAG